MKTSVIEVRAMLAVLNVDEVEKRMRDVPGVESATANFASGNITVRYDETRLDVAGIKAIVHQRGHQPAGDSVPEQDSANGTERKVAVPPRQEVAPAPAQTLVPVAPKAAPVAAVPAPAVSKDNADAGHEGHPAPGAQTSVPATAPATAPAHQGHENHHAHMAADFR